MRVNAVDIPGEAIAVVCRKWHIVRMSLFGSALGEEFRPDSDIDILVEFEPGHVPGFFGLSRIETDLEPLFPGRRVDVRTPEDLSRYFRDEVCAKALPLYEA